MVHGRTEKLERGKESIWASRPGYKPLLILIVGILFVGLVIVPPPQSMLDLVSKQRPPGYDLPSGCDTIADTVNKKLRPTAFQAVKSPHDAGFSKHGKHGAEERILTDLQVARMAKVMLAIFFLAFDIGLIDGDKLIGLCDIGKGNCCLICQRLKGIDFGLCIVIVRIASAQQPKTN